MNYSQDWQNKLNFCNSLRQTRDWETLIAENCVSITDSKATDIIYLNKPVWVSIHQMVGNQPFRKIKAISKYNAYFDGTYELLGHSPALGCLHGWYYIIDGHLLDLSNARAQDNNQERLIDLIKTYSDGFYEPVRKGILKIPTII